MDMITETIVTMIEAAFVVVFIVDLSGFSDTFCEWYGRLIHRKGVQGVKPFTCSLCMTWWTCLLVAVCDGWVCWEAVLVSALLAFLADIIGQALTMAKDILTTIISIIQNLTTRLWHRVGG